MEPNNNTIKKNVSTESFDIVDTHNEQNNDDVENEHDIPILDKPACVDEVVNTMNTNNNEEPEISTNPDDLRNAILQMPPEKREILFNQIAKFQGLQNTMADKNLTTIDENNVEDVREKLKLAMKRKRMQRQGKHIKNIEMEKMKTQLQKINDQLQNSPLEQSDNNEDRQTENKNVDEQPHENDNELSTHQEGKTINTNFGEAIVLPSAPISTEKVKEVINELSAIELADKHAAELIAKETINKSSKKNKRKSKNKN